MDLVQAVQELGKIAEAWRRVESRVEAARRSTRATSASLDVLKRAMRSPPEAASVELGSGDGGGDDPIAQERLAPTDAPHNAGPARREERDWDDRLAATIARAQATRNPGPSTDAKGAGRRKPSTSRQSASGSVVRKASAGRGSGGGGLRGGRRAEARGDGRASETSTRSTTRLPVISARKSSDSGIGSAGRPGPATVPQKQSRKEGGAPQKAAVERAPQVGAHSSATSPPITERSFSPKLQSLMKQHQVLTNKAMAAAKTGKAAEEWAEFSAKISRAIDSDAAGAELNAAYTRIAALLESVSDSDAAAGMSQPTRNTLSTVCRLSSLHEIAGQSLEELNAAHTELVEALEIEQIASTVEGRLDELAREWLESCQRSLRNAALVNGAQHADESPVVWLPVEIIGPGAAQHAASAVACATNLSHRDVWYQDVRELVHGSTLQHQVQEAVLRLELEQQLTVILAGLACSESDFGLSGSSGEAQAAEKLFAEVYRSICAMRSGNAPAFVRT